jgi:hypothetical protein
MKITQIIEHKKGVRAVKSVVKPRNFVAKNAIQSGAGAHKDKKKADKQGDVKHKAQAVSEGVLAEGYSYEEISQKVYAEHPDLPTNGRGDEFFSAAWPYIVELAGNTKRANYMLNYDEDFPSDLISAYADLQRQNQATAEGVDDAEYDDEAGMADNNLETLRRAVDGIDNVINAGDNLPEWCQEKIAVAKSMLITVWDYMRSEEERGVNEQVGTFSSSNMQMSVDGARHLAQVDLARKKYGDKETPAGFAKNWNPEVKTIADPKNPGKYQSTVTLRPNDYPLSPNLIARPSIDPNQDFDYFHKGEQLKSDHPLFNKVKQMHVDSLKPVVEPDVQEGRMTEASTNPDTMSATDYDRNQQGQMDQEKRDFKSREMQHELSDEDNGMYFVVIAKNGKWEYTKTQPRQQGMNAAQNIINSLHLKYPNMHLGMVGPNGKVFNMGKGK